MHTGHSKNEAVRMKRYMTDMVLRCKRHIHPSRDAKWKTQCSRFIIHHRNSWGRSSGYIRSIMMASQSSRRSGNRTNVKINALVSNRT